MIKAEDFKQTWEDVVGLSDEDMKQWFKENMDDLPPMVSWLATYARIPYKPNTINVRELPACAFCGKVASFRGDTKDGEWKNMCEGCSQVNGEGLGISTGYKLDLVKL